MAEKDEEGEENERPTTLREELRRIRSELDSISWVLLLFVGFSMCGTCANLDSIEGELGRTNHELRETRQVLERLLEQQRAR